METRLNSDQKREYLRLLLTEGQEEANLYLCRHKPRKMVFESQEEADEYFRQYEAETGEPYKYWAIILCPDTEDEGRGGQISKPFPFNTAAAPQRMHVH